MDRLKPKRAVFCDPARYPAAAEGFGPEAFARFKATASKEQVRAMNPRWEEVDVEIELETTAVWDDATASSPTELSGAGLLQAGPVVPPLVQLADPCFPISPERATLLRQRGFEIRPVPAAGLKRPR
ncbi:hypothetical protein [Streptomyces sp. NPDC091259]|uniref:hypothetical protein n=1 Tax=Streptomyces sp. NPDC091259 TaxID=3365976 RepID=UPI0038262703